MAYWPPRWILQKVGHAMGELDPQWDLDQMPLSGHSPASVMNEIGTWDFPIVVLYSQRGFRTPSGDRPDLRYWLIEGHLRLRYLNALVWSRHRGIHARQHTVFVV